MSRRVSRMIGVDFVNHDFFLDDHCLFVIRSTNRSPDPTTDSAADNCTFLATDFRTDSRTGTTAYCTADHGSSVHWQRGTGKTQCHRKYCNSLNIHIRPFQ